MRTVQVIKNDGPELLTLVDVPVPSPGPGEVLDQIKAVGVNFIDVYFREGRYPATCPFILGQEAAGIVVEPGPDIQGLQAGDRVAWAGMMGTYAEFACAPAATLLRVPPDLSLEDACAPLLKGLTAHYLVHGTYRLNGDETVVVHAGAGGVGLLLTQMAKQLGSVVVTTVSTEEKADFSYRAGADRVVLYTNQDFADEVRLFTNGEGVPVVYDSVGRDTFEGSLRCLRPRGMLVLYGASSGAAPLFDLMRLSTSGSLYVTRPTLKDHIKTRIALELRTVDLFEGLTSGTLQLQSIRRYRLEDAGQAHQDLGSRRTTGKLLLIP